MKRSWSVWVLVLAVLIGLGLGFYKGESRKAEAVNQQELYEAIQSWLAQAHVPQQDMPKSIIEVKPTGGGHYLVHCQMVQGEGWFEVWQEGGKWQVKGSPPPKQ